MDRKTTGYSRVNIHIGAIRYLRGAARNLYLRINPLVATTTTALRRHFKDVFKNVAQIKALADEATPWPLKTHAEVVKDGEKYTKLAKKGTTPTKEQATYAGAPAISDIPFVDCVNDNISDAMHMLMNNLKGTCVYISCRRTYYNRDRCSYRSNICMLE